ncbi:MAG: polysaccharide deacetylase family protein [Terriglobales bacterium]
MPRLDYLASVWCALPLRRLKTANGWRIPILMYHGIGKDTGASHPYFEINTTPAVFRAQLQWLRQQGFQTLSLSDALNRLRSEAAEVRQAKYVVLTFDDGYREIYEEALPLLREHGFTATVYAIADKSCGESRKSFKDRECMTRRELRELASQGIEIGSHTVTHPRLYELPWDQVEAEIHDSKKMLEDCLGTAIHSFCYPYAYPEADKRFVNRLEAFIRHCGYKSNALTVIGTADHDTDPFRVPRLPVNTWDDERFLRAKVEGGYDWLHVPQFMFKLLKRPFGWN